MARLRFPWDKDQTDENEIHMFPDDVDPVRPPKGDVMTGRPLADELDGIVGATPNVNSGKQHRETVDREYANQASGKRDFYGDAKKMEGSVFDTWTDKALRMGASDPMGGLGPMKIVPKGGAGAAFSAAEVQARSMMKRLFPKVEAALERSPQEFNVRYDSKVTKPRGQTDAYMNPETRQLDKTRPVDIRFSPEKAEAQTFAHEPLHALLLASGKKGEFPRAAEILKNRGETPWSAIKEYFLRAGKDTGHAAVYKVADDMASKAGHTLPRNSIRPRGGMDVK